jgi:hypothetical protein
MSYYCIILVLNLKIIQENKRHDFEFRSLKLIQSIIYKTSLVYGNQ